MDFNFIYGIFVKNMLERCVQMHQGKHFDRNRNVLVIFLFVSYNDLNAERAILYFKCTEHQGEGMEVLMSGGYSKVSPDKPGSSLRS